MMANALPKNKRQIPTSQNPNQRSSAPFIRVYLREPLDPEFIQLTIPPP